MKISIQKATSQLDTKIVKFLIENHLYKTNKNKWYALLEHQWSLINYRGYCLMDDKKIVGFFGIIFSDFYKDRDLKFANVTTWVVNKNYRGHSIKLLKKIMENDEYILISHSTINNILKIYFRYGWKIFEDKYFLVFQNPLRKIKSQIPLRISGKYPNNKHLIKILDDHRDYKFFYKLMIFDSEEFLIIGKEKYYKRYFKYIEIYFISDVKFFNNHMDMIYHLLKSEIKFSFLKIDKRFIEKKSKLIFFEKDYKNIKKIYFSKKIHSFDHNLINNLYTENFLLDI